jgi:hypothetical protein
MANTKVSQLSSLSNIDSTTVFLVSSNTSGTLTSYKTPISSVSNAVTANLGNIKSTNLDGNSSNVLYGNGVFSTVVANTVDILNTNGLTTTFYPTFVENRTTNQTVRADVDLTYRTDTNRLSVGNLSVSGTANITGNIAANNIGNISSVNLNGNSSQVLYGNGVFAAAGGGSYGDSNVTTLLSSFGSNSISTTGNIVAGTANISGNTTTGISAINLGVTTTPLPNTIASFNSNVNYYTQVTLQNKSTGADATADFIVTADNGSDTVNYLDLGIINSGYDANTPTNSLGNIVYAADSYIYAQGNTSNTNQSGGNLVIGTSTSGKNVKIFVGGVNSNAIMANISNTGMTVNGNVTASNYYGTSANVSLVASNFTATFDNTGVFTLPSCGGDEGGEINLGIPTSNTTLSTRVVLDVYRNQLRFYDGSTKGAYVDLSQAGTGVSTLLNNRVSGYVNAGTYVTMDNLKATVSTAGNRSLQIATVSGSFSAYINGLYSLYTGSTSGSGVSVTVTTTPALAINWNFTSAGDLATYIISDTTNSLCYRVTMLIGGSYNNNMISIERLI